MLNITISVCNTETLANRLETNHDYTGMEI